MMSKCREVECGVTGFRVQGCSGAVHMGWVRGAVVQGVVGKVQFAMVQSA